MGVRSLGSHSGAARHTPRGLPPPQPAGPVPLSRAPLSQRYALAEAPPHRQPRWRRARPPTSAFSNHRSHLLCLAADAGLHVLLFALAASAHRAPGPSVMVAKDCASVSTLTVASSR